MLDANAGLADRLWAARETAEAVKSADGRTRAALYRALSLAYDFAVAAQASPEDYAELLEDSGVKAQARAPMTPIVKLVFGIDYDKARLTEFAAALAFAERQQVALSGFEALHRQRSRAASRRWSRPSAQARRPEPRADTQGEAARAKLRNALRRSRSTRLPSDDEFSVVDHPPQSRRPSRGRRRDRRSRDRRAGHPPRRLRASRGVVTVVRAGL